MNKIIVTLGIVGAMACAAVVEAAPRDRGNPPPPRDHGRGEQHDRGDRGPRGDRRDGDRGPRGDRRDGDRGPRGDRRDGDRGPRGDWRDGDRGDRGERHEPRRNGKYSVAATVSANGAKEVSFAGGAGECYLEFESGSTVINTIVVREGGKKRSVTVASRFDRGQRYVLPLGGYATGIRISCSGGGSFKVWYR